jgi:hypothetical protein
MIGGPFWVIRMKVGIAISLQRFGSESVPRNRMAGFQPGF